MGFDPLTLWVIVAFVGSISGVGTLLAGWMGGRERCLSEWGLGTLLLAFGVGSMLLRDFGPVLFFIVFTNSLLLAGWCLQWIALRSFAGRVSHLWWIGVAPLLWCLACSIPFFQESMATRIVLYSILSTSLNGLALREIWRAPLPDPAMRWVMRGLGIAVLALNAFRLFVAVLMPEQQNAVTPLTQQAAAFGVYAMCVVVFTNLMLVFAVRDQSLRALRMAARRDELTGLHNRGGFMEEACDLLQSRCEVSLVMFDLDHFKQINDRYGHAAGDRVLALVGALLRQGPFAGAVNGRLGGEEFAALLPVSPGEAVTLAEEFAGRLRAESRDLGLGSLAAPFAVTMSAGVASVGPTMGTTPVAARLEALLRQADAALYRAKAHGRDRVEAEVGGRNPIPSS